MSFSSLLSQITKDKKPQDKIKPISKSLPTNSNETKNKLIKQSTNKSLLKTSSNSSTTSYNIDNDPAVARLKEARRLEREKLQALKNAKSKRTIKSKNNSISTSSSSSSSSSSTSKRSSNIPSDRMLKSSSSPVEKRQNVNLGPIPPAKSRFKFKPQRQSLNSNAPILKNSQSSAEPPNSSNTPKLSFRDLMKKAENIDKSSTAVIAPFKSNIKPDVKEPSKAYQSIQRARIREQSPINRPLNTNYFKDKSIISQNNNTNTQQKPTRLPSFAKPNPELLNKLAKKKQYVSQSDKKLKRAGRVGFGYQQKIKQNKDKDSYDIDAKDEDEEDDENFGYGYEDEYDYDSQDDGFIVDDDEFNAFNTRKQREKQYDDMRSQGYSRDEIWEIFNRGKKRAHYNDTYDSDDMEATGTEILEDEERTLKQAKLDDLREQKLLEKRALEKKKLFRK